MDIFKEFRKLFKIKAMQKIQIVGNIGKDAEVRNLEGGKSVISFSVAVTEKYKDKETTTWFNCQKWNAENIGQYLKQGTKVYVEGKILEREHEGKKYWSVNVEHLELFSTVKKESQEKSNDNEYTPEPESDDLPF